MDGLDQDDPATGKRGVEHRTSNIEHRTPNIEHRTSKWKNLNKRHSHPTGRLCLERKNGLVLS
jgi:hypothetical protein